MVSFHACVVLSNSWHINNSRVSVADAVSTQSQQLWQWTHMCARCQVCELKSKYEDEQSIDRKTTLKWNIHKPSLTPLERRPNPITLKPKGMRKKKFEQPTAQLDMQNPTKSI